MSSELVKKICKSLPVDADNQVSYRINSEGPIKGLFSFSYYVPALMTNLSKGYVYSEGISLYIRMIEEYPELWNGWRVVLYMDETSLERGVINPTKYKANDPDDDATWIARRDTFLNVLRLNPHVIVATVRWDEYKMNAAGSSVNANIMRCFRFKAFEDFPDVPVYVRDADTIFVDESMSTEGYWIKIPTLREITPVIVSDWEEEYHKGFSKKGSKYRFALATQPDYSRGWHTAKNAGDRGGGPNMIGFYAGVVGSLGDIDEWKNGLLWQSCVSYLRGKCRVEQGFSREGAPIVNFVTTRKLPHMDEPLLAFVILPEIWEKIFFFHYEFIELAGVSLDISKFYGWPQTVPDANREAFEKVLAGYKSFPSVKLGREGKYWVGSYKGRLYSGRATPLGEKLNIDFEKAQNLLKEGKESEARRVIEKAKWDPYYRPETTARNEAILARKNEELLRRTLERLDPGILNVEREARFGENRNLWALNEDASPKEKRLARIDANHIRAAFQNPHYHTFLQRLVAVLMDLNGFRLTCKVGKRIETRRGGALRKKRKTRRRH
jgi:hypothetical protein